MQWLASLVEQLGQSGSAGAALFILLYAAATISLAPAFILTMAAGAIFGVIWGSLLVLIGATIGASAAYAIAVRLSGTRWMRRLDGEPRVVVVRRAVGYKGVWVQFLLRLSPLVPFVLLNYALGLARVRYRDFALAMVGMLPAIVMYAYYGRVIGDVAALAAGAAPPRGRAYYVLLTIGLLATVAATTLITRAARRAIEQQQQGRSQA